MGGRLLNLNVEDKNFASSKSTKSLENTPAEDGLYFGAEFQTFGQEDMQPTVGSE